MMEPSMTKLPAWFPVAGNFRGYLVLWLKVLARAEKDRRGDRSYLECGG
jgi:hypothetical protein